MKNEIRRAMRSKNIALTTRSRDTFANEIFNTIERSDIFARASTIALFASLPDELPTQEVISKWSEEKTILLPRVGADFSMEFYEYDQSSMAIGEYGIPSPQGLVAYPAEKIDVIIVPGVAFTPSGQRLGRGKGYYDRFLSRADAHAYTIGVCYPHQCVDSLPCEEHDVIINRVVCAKG